MHYSEGDPNKGVYTYIDSTVVGKSTISNINYQFVLSINDNTCSIKAAATV